MKSFSALLALACIGTANAGAVTSATLEMAPLSAGSAPESMVMKMTLASALAASGATITATFTAGGGTVWTASQAPTCTLSKSAAGVAQTATAAVSVTGKVIVLTPTSIIAAEALTVTCVKFQTANPVTTSTIVATTVTSSDASGGTSNTLTITAATPMTAGSMEVAVLATLVVSPSIVFKQTLTTRLIASATSAATSLTIALTAAGGAPFTASKSPTCVLNDNAAGAHQTAITSTSADGKTLTLTPTSIIEAGALTITCTNHLEANAAAASTIAASTTSTADTTALATAASAATTMVAASGAAGVSTATTTLVAGTATSVDFVTTGLLSAVTDTLFVKIVPSSTQCHALAGTGDALPGGTCTLTQKSATAVLGTCHITIHSTVPVSTGNRWCTGKYQKGSYVDLTTASTTATTGGSTSKGTCDAETPTNGDDCEKKDKDKDAKIAYMVLMIVFILATVGLGIALGVTNREKISDLVSNAGTVGGLTPGGFTAASLGPQRKRTRMASEYGIGIRSVA